MEHIVVGLGNPGEEYTSTRHNVGRMVVESLKDRWGTSDWREDKKLHAKVSQGSVGGHDIKLVLPENYMNRSGASVSPLIKSKKQAESLIVVHDDIDLGTGVLRIVFDRGAGGHKGVLSIERVLRTRAFVRLRVGVVPMTLSGKLKKPKGDEKIHELILKQLTKKEREVIDRVVANAVLAVEAIVTDGRAKAMCDYNKTIS